MQVVEYYNRNVTLVNEDERFVAVRNPMNGGNCYRVEFLRRGTTDPVLPAIDIQAYIPEADLERMPDYKIKKIIHILNLLNPTRAGAFGKADKSA